MGTNGAPTPLELGDLFQERYEVVRVLGVGGMGAVYEVLDRNTHRHRALKVMLPRSLGDDTLRLRFRREATVAARIDSEHLADVLDAGVDVATDCPFIVLELLKGEELGDMINRRGALPPGEVFLYLRQAAMALDKAHAIGVVHRDLKPENLFITYRDDGAPRLKLLDFGIAKVIEGTVDGPETQGVLGTPLYMAPEQLHGEVDISPAADVYAMTLIAYAALVGVPYYHLEQQTAGNVYALLLKVNQGPTESAVARARHAGVTLPVVFDAWFARGTHRDPGARFATVNQLVDALGSALGLADASDHLISRPSDAGDTADEDDALARHHGGRPQVNGPAATDHTVVLSEPTAATSALASSPPASAAHDQAQPHRDREVAQGAVAAFDDTTSPLSHTVVPLRRQRWWPWAVAAATLVVAAVGWRATSTTPSDDPGHTNVDVAASPSGAAAEAPSDAAAAKGATSSERGEASEGERGADEREPSDDGTGTTGEAADSAAPGNPNPVDGPRAQPSLPSPLPAPRAAPAPVPAPAPAPAPATAPRPVKPAPTGPVLPSDR